jgi:hypothetical protein
MHNITMAIDLTVSKAAEGDLSTITNPASTPAQVAAALAVFQEASALADDSLDELIEIVYQIIMDGRNVDLQLPSGTISNRWIDQVRKDDPIPRGEYVILTGSMQLTCGASEAVPGDIGIPGDIYDFTIEQPDDEVQKTGKEGTLGGGD